MICENRKYLKINADTLMTKCDEIISVMDIASTNKTNTIARNEKKYYHSKKVRYKFDCYVLHAVLLVIMLLLIITIICYYCAKQKRIGSSTIQNEF